MDTFLYITNQILDPIGIWFGLLLSIPIIWTWLDLVWGKRRKHRQWHDKASQTKGRLPAVMIIDLLPGRDISTAVAHYIASQENLKDIPEERIIKVSRDKNLRPEDMPTLAREIQDAIGIVLRHGADELSVFFAGPGCVSAMVGAELSNISCRVLIYQNDNTTNTYVNFGPLRHPRF